MAKKNNGNTEEACTMSVETYPKFVAVDGEPAKHSVEWWLQPVTERVVGRMFVEVTGVNPNGDPDRGGAPRITAGDYGLITGVSLKRRARDEIGRMTEEILEMNGKDCAPSGLLPLVLQNVEGDPLKALCDAMAKNLYSGDIEVSPGSEGFERAKRVAEDVKKMVMDEAKQQGEAFTAKQMVEMAVRTYQRKFFDARLFGCMVLSKKEKKEGDKKNDKDPFKCLNSENLVRGGDFHFRGQCSSLDPIVIQENTITSQRPVEENRGKGMGNVSFVTYGLYAVDFGFDPRKNSVVTRLDLAILKALFPYLFRTRNSGMCNASGVNVLNVLWFSGQDPRGADLSQKILGFIGWQPRKTEGTQQDECEAALAGSGHEVSGRSRYQFVKLTDKAQAKLLAPLGWTFEELVPGAEILNLTDEELLAEGLIQTA